MKEKTFFLIPGFRMQIKNKPFHWLVDYLEDKGIKVIKTPVRWNYKTLLKILKNLLIFITKTKVKKTMF